MLLIFKFFFKDTATPEIYTYCHTLSLHDALPICHRRHCFLPLAVVYPTRLAQANSSPRRRDGARLGWRSDRTEYAGTALVDGVLHWFVCRSEEHTSELQSLMRISYAVFCLKKKNQKSSQ